MLDIQPSNVAPRFALDSGDRLVLCEQNYLVVERRENRVVLAPAEGNRLSVEYTDTQLAHFSRMGQLRHEACRVATPEDDMVVTGVAQFLASRTPEQIAEADLMEAVIFAFEALYREGRVKRTYASIEEHMDAILMKAGLLNKDPGDTILTIKEPMSAKTLLRYAKRYEQYGRLGLFRNHPSGANRERRLQPAARGIMNRIVQGYLDPKKPTKQKIHGDVVTAITEANARRRVSGEEILLTPSRETVRKAINALDPFLVCLAREGKEKAKRFFAPVGRGLHVERPLQRVEIDEWDADIIVMLGESGLLELLDVETRKQLEKKKGRFRVMVTVAIDCATRCILGMRISPRANTQSALETIEMILDDKGVYADAVGALTPWHMAGKPGLIVTDCAKYNISKATRNAVAAIGCRLEHCPAGEPEMKATIERLFGTISTRLMPRLNGRTMHDVVAKGDRDPEADAALTIEDFSDILVRWVVDVYHTTPHRGLCGATPLDAWNHLGARYGATPPPGKQTRMLAFGRQVDRVLHKTGVTLMNIRYHCRALAERMMHDNDRMVTIRWHQKDLGSIMVDIDGTWHEVRAVHSMYDGVSAETWAETSRVLRARNKANAELHVSIVEQALKDIDAINARAVRNSGIITKPWTDARVAVMEETMFIGFNVSDEVAPSGSDTMPNGGNDFDDFGMDFGMDLPAAADAGDGFQPTGLLYPADSDAVAGEPIVADQRGEASVDEDAEPTARREPADDAASHDPIADQITTSAPELRGHAAPRAARPAARRGRRGTDESGLGVTFE